MISFKGRKNMTVNERFDLSYTVSHDGCWIWHGSIKRGCPTINIRQSKSSNARRFSFERFIGPVFEENISCISTCGNKLCVNPEHLELVDKARHAANLAKQKTDSLKNCKKCGASKFDFVQDARGSYVCQNCQNERSRKRKHTRIFCKNGHSLSDSNVCVLSNGTRMCLLCRGLK